MLLSDIRYGLRNMARNPGVTAIAIVTLALGIGVNTAMFSVVNAVLLRPLPYRDPDRLVTIRAQIPSRHIFGAFLEYNTFTDFFRPGAHSFESMTASTPGSVSLTAGGDPERLFMHRVNAGFLGMAGVRPLLGRDFRPEEDQPNGTRVAILSQGLWKRRFGSDPAVVGRTVQLDRAPYTVVGVLPPEFELYGSEVELYLPMAAPSARVPGMPSVAVHARLKPGVSVKAAQSEIDSLCRQWIDRYHYPDDWGGRVQTIRDFAVRDVRPNLTVLAVAVGLVLLIACANVANLLLARAGARSREMAVRSALGAGRTRIVRQLLTEGALLATFAGAIGLFAAWGGVRALAAGSATYLPFQKQVTVDARVLAYTLAATLLTTLLFGLAPAIAAIQAGLSDNLKEGGRAGESRRSSYFRSALVVVEVALALLLAIGATLTSRSLARLEAVDPGFRPAGVLKATVNLRGESYATPGQRVSFFNALSEKVRTMPGIVSAGLVSDLPFGGSKSASDIVVEGAAPTRPGELIAFMRNVDAGYFQTLQVRLLKGRYFESRDLSGPPAAIVNDALARKCWPNQDPIGKRYSVGRRNTNWITVVGVVADLRQSNLADEPDLEAYVPYRLAAGNRMSIVVRTRNNPASAGPVLRATLREIDKDLPLAEVGLLEENVDRSLRARRFSVALLAGFAALALLLAAVGIYGVISYSVTRRQHEIGVRMALGAERGRIAGMVVAGAVSLGALGVVIGAAGGYALTHLLRSMLFGVSATDPFVFAGSSLFLLAVAALAGYIPARRAARVDPSSALRDE